MRLRRFVLPAVIAAIALLTGCASQAATPISPSTEAAATPSMTSAPKEAAVARVIVGSQRVEVLTDDDTSISSVRYFDPVDQMVKALTQAFSDDPVITPDLGGNDVAPGTRYTWGGFAVVERDVLQSEPYAPAVVVYWDTADVNGIRIEAAGGIAVGDPTDPLTAAGPDGLLRSSTTEYVMFRVDLTPLPAGVEYGDTPSFAVSVLAVTGGSVTRMVAPAANWGA